MSIAPTNMRPKQRPAFVTSRVSAVRSVVASWHGRSLSVQHIGDLLRALHVLEAQEADLYKLSPHAPRLLENLRRELQSPHHQQDA
jgi:hypothetical protein